MDNTVLCQHFSMLIKTAPHLQIYACAYNCGYKHTCPMFECVSELREQVPPPTFAQDIMSVKLRIQLPMNASQIFWCKWSRL